MAEPKTRLVCTALAWIALLNLGAAPPTDDTRRIALRDFAIKAFKESPANHCSAFVQIAKFSSSTAPDASTWLEDMRLVIVGADWKRRPERRGKYYTGSISKDSGFKAELQDGSPQVEHAMAAIILGKAAPPGAAEIAGQFIELVTAGVPHATIDAADYKLWAYGADIGARVANRNLKDVSTAIARTFCR